MMLFYFPFILEKCISAKYFHSDNAILDKINFQYAIKNSNYE